jgi:methylated-DNA-[protein]-cysteine S-methyltransferase
MTLALDRIECPIGTINVVAGPSALIALDFGDCTDRMLSYLRTRYRDVDLTPRPDPNGYSTRVRAYLDGDLQALDAIAVDAGGTAFQQRVWSALRTIPAGQTRSYGDIAVQIGQPTASRAVGMANSRNPVAIVVPCHRVIGSNNKLVGYAGGIDRKRWLLAHEGMSQAKINSALLACSEGPLFASKEYLLS